MKQFKTLTELKCNMSREYEENFFSRKTRRFFGDKKHYWSKSRQVLVITREMCGKLETVEYKPVFRENGEVELRVNN